MAVEDCDSVDLQRNPGGMGYPLRLKRVTARIPAQTVRGTRAEEPQAAHGVEGEGARMEETSYCLQSLAPET